jgi:intracellular multiplication protein IcmN
MYINARYLVMRKEFNTLKKLSIMVVSVAILSLVGCSQPKSRMYIDDGAPHATVSIDQQRQLDINNLEKNGVSVISMGETVRIIVPGDSLFVAGSANLQKDYADAILPTMANYIKSFSTEHIGVTAYSDSTATKNIPVVVKRALTDRQAQVVASQLWSHGLDTRLLVAEGFGAQHAIAWNGTLAGQHDNRRVEINFHFYPTEEDVN